MNCTHVWNYVQTAAFLFPELERSVRHTDFEHNTRQNGDMAFRTLLPLVASCGAHAGRGWPDGHRDEGLPRVAAERQHGRSWSSVWPGVKRAVEHCWQPGGWDADKDGVMEGKQHNTYDIEFYGPNTMMGTFYLGALRAAEEMAKALSLEEARPEYRELYERGRQRIRSSYGTANTTARS